MAEIKNISQYKQQIETLKKQITTEFNKNNSTNKKL